MTKTKATTEEARERLRALKEEEARRLLNEPYRYYEPTGRGEEFINLIGNGDAFIVLYSAANGVGKTATGANVLAHLFWPCGNPWFQGKIFTDFPYKKQGRIVSTPTSVEKNIIPEMKRWFPKGKYETSKGNRPFESKWKIDGGLAKGGWEFDIMTYEQDPMEFEGVTLGWAWFDEPPPEAILKATIARMRKGGIIFIGATPLAGSAYLFDMFAKGKVEIEVRSSETGAAMKYERKIGYVEADIESACKQHGVRGHLDHDVIMQIIAEYSEDEKQARIYGKFQHLVGLVFKQFTRKVHVIPPFQLNERDFCVYEMLDPHPRNPDATLWLAVDRQGTKYVVDELWLKANGDEELAQRIKAKATQYRVVRRIGDPSMFIEDQHTQSSLAKRLSNLGLAHLEATKSRTMSDRRIGDALKYTEVNGHMVKAPEVYIFDTCERTIWEMEHYRWDEWTGKAADKHMARERPLDKDDHMIENLGRGLFQEPVFVPFARRTQHDTIDFESYGEGKGRNDDGASGLSTAFTTGY